MEYGRFTCIPNVRVVSYYLTNNIVVVLSMYYNDD